MYLLIPGRHHCLSQFQARYLFRFFNGGLDGETDTRGRPLSGVPEAAIFAVTSADHQSTRRNPLPFFIRAMAIHGLGTDLRLPLFVHGIPEVGTRPDFAAYTIKTISHESEGRFDLRPGNTVVVCATAVADLYSELGYQVWAGEKAASMWHPTGGSAGQASGGPAHGSAANPGVAGESLPWDLIERIASGDRWQNDAFVLEHLHPASYRLFVQYGLGERLRRLFSDPIVSDDGDITVTRDYGSYVRQMDENIDQKWEDTRNFVRPGRIGDIGCAVGSWLKKAAEDEQLVNSDFFGIEITRPLYEICVQRRQNGDFATPNIWFAQRNAVRDLVFHKGTMSTIHSSSLTHEIESYGGRGDLIEFIANRFAELEHGGVWINRDVIGPEDGDRMVRLDLTTGDGIPEANHAYLKTRPAGGTELKLWLDALSTAARFFVFAGDFRRHEGFKLDYKLVTDPVAATASATASGAASSAASRAFVSVRLKLRDAAEFMLTKDYTDNWQSEMHETFCHWAYSDWLRELKKAGFELSASSHVFTNPWILEHRWLGKVSLRDDSGTVLPWPPTNAILIARKP